MLNLQRYVRLAVSRIAFYCVLTGFLSGCSILDGISKPTTRSEACDRCIASCVGSQVPNCQSTCPCGAGF